VGKGIAELKCCPAIRRTTLRDQLRERKEDGRGNDCRKVLSDSNLPPKGAETRGHARKFFPRTNWRRKRKFEKEGCKESCRMKKKPRKTGSCRRTLRGENPSKAAHWARKSRARKGPYLYRTREKKKTTNQEERGRQEVPDTKKISTLANCGRASNGCSLETTTGARTRGQEMRRVVGYKKGVRGSRATKTSREGED